MSFLPCCGNAKTGMSLLFFPLNGRCSSWWLCLLPSRRIPEMSFSHQSLLKHQSFQRPNAPSTPTLQVLLGPLFFHVLVACTKTYGMREIQQPCTTNCSSIKRRWRRYIVSHAGRRRTGGGFTQFQIASKHVPMTVIWTHTWQLNAGPLGASDCGSTLP